MVSGDGVVLIVMMVPECFSLSVMVHPVEASVCKLDRHVLTESQTL